MELSDAADEMSSKEMDVDSADEMSSKEMDIDSDLSLASPPPEAHDGSDCSSSTDWNDTEPPRGMIRGMSLSASSEEEGQDESEGREMDLEDSDVEMCSVQGAPSSNSWRPVWIAEFTGRATWILQKSKHKCLAQMCERT